MDYSFVSSVLLVCYGINPMLGVSTRLFASFGPGYYFCSAFERYYLFDIWRLFNLLPGCLCWIAYFLVHILRPVLSRRRGIIRRVA